MKVVAIVGSRDYPAHDYDSIREEISKLAPDTLVISGGARGVDTVAASYARQRGLVVIEHPADWASHGRAAGPRRNTEIAQCCDEMLAFWDGESSGTRDAVKKARAMGKPTRVFVPW